MLELEADRLQNLILDEEALNNEKKIVTEELRLRMENNPQSRLMGSVWQAFWEHPYSHSPAGTKEDIQNADSELCKSSMTVITNPKITSDHFRTCGSSSKSGEVRELYKLIMERRQYLQRLRSAGMGVSRRLVLLMIYLQ